jgi:hypothetical protein
MAQFLNSDGQVVRFGRDQGNRNGRAGVTTSTTKLNELVLEVELAGPAGTRFQMDRNNDGTNDGFSGLDTPIPAGARLISQNVIEVQAPAGGTGFTVGTFNINGTAIDEDGIRVAAGTNGAQIGTQLTADNFVTVTTAGTYTAGKVKIIVQYMIR